MRCSKCGSDNREGANFCNACGTALDNKCGACGALNQPGAKFCDECGAALTGSVTAKAEGVAPFAGERRHLTVLFCDLVGSTEIAAQLDPEEWREVVGAYHRGAAEAITRFGGHVAKYLGDGVMAYFGWPEAHDNDGERAARAGLALFDGIAKLNDQAPPPLPSPMSNNGGGNTRLKLVARVGIDSGAVVVGAGADKGAEVFGETPNIAARLQATAVPGTVLITAATHRLISGLFVVESLGPRALKGIATPLEVFQVVRPTGVRGRLQAAHGLTPFVGREEELPLLLRRWERTREGEGQLALVIGEPGIGKSRLAAEFHDHIRDAPHIWMESGGEQFFENTPFHAIIEMLSRWLELQDAANSEEQCERVERALAAAGHSAAETAPLIADLLQLPAGERYPVSTLTAEQKRRRLLAALSGWILGAARVQPLVMVVEDLHWLDPSTLELLQLLAEQGATAPLMLLYTARPEFRAPWPMRTHHSQITLNRLSARDVREMVSLVAARNALPGESVEAVVKRTGGVPLFVEELTRAVLEGGNALGIGREIPATLHDSLIARLDRLGPAKEIIKIGAVIGGEFSYTLLRAVHPVGDEDLQGAIRKAIDAELIYARGLPPDAAYQFKHVLIRDAAYEALLRSLRKQLHSRIAEVLVDQFPQRVTSAPELVAHHYTEAGLGDQAIPYWQQAGQKAAERSANAEAINHLCQGLDLLKTLPSTPKHLAVELSFQVMLGSVMMAAKGYAAPEVERTYLRARVLCEQVGDSSQLFPILRGLLAYYVNREELGTARDLGEQLLNLAQRGQDRTQLTQAHYLLGLTDFFLGESSSVLSHTEQGLALYDPGNYRALRLYTVEDPAVSCHGFAALALWLLGYPEQAMRRIDQALISARELSSPYNLTFALVFAAWLHQFRRAAPKVQELAETIVTLATEQGFPFWAAFGTALHGWARAEQGQEQEGILQLSQGWAAWQGTGARTLNPYFRALLAELQGKIGQADECFAGLAEALRTADASGERFYEAELYRLQGALRFSHFGARNLEKDTEEFFREAVAVARRQQAKSLELRSTTSLARLLANQGRRDEARSLLAEIYGWFTEGFDTMDLKEAKAMLDELAQ